MSSILLFRAASARASWALLVLSLAFAGLSVSACGGGQKKTDKAKGVDDDDEGHSGEHKATAPDIGDDEDDDLQIAGLKGRLAPSDIRAGIEPHQQALFDCFTTKVGKRRYLGGDVEFQFVVNPDGTVKSAHMLRTDLGNWDMEKCMLDICAQMKFVPPEGRAEADFTVPLSFEARSRVSVWDDARAQEEVGEERVAELAACAEESGADNPSGVWFTLYIGPRGKVLSVGLTDPAGPVNQDWATCAVGKMKAWELTDPRGRAKMSYQYNP